MTPPTYPEPAETDVVTSQSAIEQMRLCPARRGYRHDPGYVKLFGRSAIQGIVVHDAVEKILAGEKVGEVLDEGRLIDEMKRILEASGHDPSKVASPAKYANAAARCRDMAKALVRWWKRSGLEVETVEEQLYLPLDTLPDGRGLWATGIIDLVATDGDRRILVDWKTASRPWENGKAEAKVQAGLYAAILRHAGRPVDEALYVVVDQKLNVVEHSVPITDQLMDAAIADAAQWARMEAYEVFPHTPWPQVSVYDYQAKESVTRRGWHCSPTYCPAWNICTGKYLDPNLGDPGEIEVTW